MTTPLIEAMARAIADGIGDDFDHAHRDKPHWIETRGESGGRYRDINEPRQPDFIDAAQAALTAITEAGYVVVPKHPGKAILDAMARVDPRERMQDFDHEKYLAAIRATNNGKAE